MKRLVKREPFPRDRQTFAYRPSELVGLAVGISAAEGRSSASAGWIRSVIQELPGKSPPTNAWALLLYHYAASIVGIQFPLAIPARLSEYETTELGLLVPLFWLKAGCSRHPISSQMQSRAPCWSEWLRKALLPRDTERLCGIVWCPFAEPEKPSFSTPVPLTASQPASPFGHPIPTITIMKQKILFLAANPSNETRLALGQKVSARSKPRFGLLNIEIAGIADEMGSASE